MPSPRLLLIPVTLTAALLLAGCSGGTSPTPSASEDSPLTAYMNAIYTGGASDEDQQAKWKADDKKREELVGECMTEQGFEYIPNVQDYDYAADSGDYKPDDPDWVAEYGYGIIDFPGMNDDSGGQEYVDPNADYVASLSESEQQAFNEALSGPPLSDDAAASAETEYDWTTAGCYGSANHEMEGDDPTQSSEFKPLMDALNEFYTDEENAPELADVNADWSDCMADAGYAGFTVQTDSSSAIGDAVNKLYEDAGDTGPAQADLDALGTKEIEQAEADLQCRTETDYASKRAAVIADLEQQFIDDHKTELEALKAAAEQGK